MLFNSPCHTPGRDSASPVVQKNRCFTLARAIPLFALFQTIVSKRLNCHRADGNDALFGTFADDSNNLQLKINIAPVKAHKLADANSCGVKYLEYCPIANIQSAFNLDRSQQTKDVVHGKKCRQRFFLLGRLNQKQRILLDPMHRYQVSEKTLKRRNFSADGAFLPVLGQGCEIGANDMDVYFSCIDDIRSP